MSTLTEYIPQSGDFDETEILTGVQQLTRPSLSYWQDAWLRLKKNRRALASLCIVVALILFTILGPVIWRVDPALQDLDQISQPTSFGKPATIAPPYEAWEGVILEDFPAEPDEEPEE